MSSLAAASQGIPIPVDEIRAALMSAAIPGFTGSLQLELSLRAEAAACVGIMVIRRQSVKAEPGAAMRQELPDPQRKKPVEKVIDDIKNLLFVRTVLVAVEAHYLNGVLQSWNKMS